MSLPSLNTSGYISCIKIFGQPILPPLMSEERRKEVSEDKAKAIHIEQRIYKKRNSVDSGVMTSSYSDNVKSENRECVSVRDNCGSECHEYKNSPVINVTAIKDFLNNNYPHSEIDNCSANLHTNTPQNYKFKPFMPVNSIINIESEASNDNKGQTTNTVCQQKNKILDSYYSYEQLSDGNPTIATAASFNDKQDCRNVICNNVKDLETYQEQQVDHSHEENRDLLGISTSQDLRLKHQLNETSNNRESNKISDKENTEKDPHTPQNMIRRSSYTLESPSPVLLEHLLLQEKQKTFIISDNINANSNKTENLNYNSSPSKENLYPLYKSASIKRRRVWNKAEAKAYWTHHPNSQGIRLTKSVTSIPASTCMNPLNVRFHSLSLESLTITSNISEYVEDCNRRHSSVSYESDPVSINQIRSASAESFSKTNNTDLAIHVNSGLEYNQRTLTNKPCQFEKIDSETKSDTLILPKPEEYLISNLLALKNSNECNSHFTKEAVFSHNDVLSVRDKHYSSSVTQQGNIYPHKCNTEHSEDSISFCSTSSLNQGDNVHQQQDMLNSEDQACLTALKVRHDQQIKELLQKQQEELKRLSVSDSFANSVLESNISRLSSSQSSQICCTEMSLDISGRSVRSFCNRELFPKSSGYSREEIRAATIINAYARGFLTRRLLRTKQVCQIIETIRESLVCALEMRNEQQLELKDLQLHDRLIQQLTHGCHELHSIFSLSAAERMAIIAADREKELHKLTCQFKQPAVSFGTRRSMLRKQNKKMVQDTSFTKPSENNRKIRSRTSSSGTSDSSLCSSRSRISAKSQQPPSPCLSRKPWR